jgi:hypothetical protein
MFALKPALLFAPVLMLLLGARLSAQIHTGAITGLVTDSSGAVVPHAQVKITNIDTNVTRDLVTDSAGLYDAPDLLPGHYSVAGSFTGFRSESKVGLILSLGQTLTVNFTLTPGATKQEVTVVGTAEQLVDSTTSTIGEVITLRPVQELPLNGRSYLQLVALDAGVAPPPPGSDQFFINGTRGSGTNYLVEGNDTSSPTSDANHIVPNLEAIGEFNVVTNNFDAEYGHSMGGVVNVHIRSGSNALHGSAFEYARNTVLDARNFFDVPNRLPYNYNQFGGSAGGPIVKNKLFIFGDYQGARTRQSGTTYTIIPTKAEDSGNFSDLLPGTAIYDPTTFPRTQFANNGILNYIPPARQDPVAALMFSLLPSPNASSGPFNFVHAQGVHSNTDSADLRIDYNLSRKDRLSGTFVLQRVFGGSQSLFGSRLNSNQNATDSLTKNTLYSLDYTRSLSAAMVNEFSVGLMRGVNLVLDAPLPGWQYEPTLGMPGLNPSPNLNGLNGFPLIIPNGYNNFGGPLGGGLGGPANNTHNLPQVSDSLSFVKGPHSFKAGFSAIFRQYNLDQDFSTRGAYVFIPYATSLFPVPSPPGPGGNSAASALVGYPYVERRQLTTPYGERKKEYGAYFQDAYKATKRLTLDLGVRYDLYMPATEAFNRLSNFVPSTLSFLLPGKNGVSNSTLAANPTDFSPHVGFAYQATKDGKTVIRGGYAIGYLNLVSQEVGSVTDRLMDNPNFNLFDTQINFPLGPVPPANISVPLMSSGFPLAPQNLNNLCCGVQVYSIPHSQPMPYTQQWNLDVQRVLPGNFLLDVAYVGTAGVHLTGDLNLNQAPPGPTPAGPRSPLSPNIGLLDYLANHENSIYHALQVKVERRITSGLYLLGTYTYSKSIDDGSIAAGVGDQPVASAPAPQDSFHPGAERGLSDFDLRHRMVVSYLYELPFGKGRKFLSTSGKVMDAFLGGWQANGILSAQTGSPFTPRLANGSGDINTGVSGTVRPYLVGNPRLPAGKQSIQQWYNIAAFAVPGQDGTPAYTFGNSGRNIVRGPNSANLDFSLFKNFAITDRLKLQFRSEFFNVTNHTNFSLPDPNVDESTAAIISGAAPPRLIQFALKLLF